MKKGFRRNSSDTELNFERTEYLSKIKLFKPEEIEIPLTDKFEGSSYLTLSYPFSIEIVAGKPALCYIHFSLLHSLDYELFKDRVCLSTVSSYCLAQMGATNGSCICSFTFSSSHTKNYKETGEVNLIIYLM